MAVAGTAGGRIAPGVGSNLLGQHAQDRNQEATVYVGNLDPQVGPVGIPSRLQRCAVGQGPQQSWRARSLASI